MRAWCCRGRCARAAAESRRAPVAARRALVMRPSGACRVCAPCPSPEKAHRPPRPGGPQPGPGTRIGLAPANPQSATAALAAMQRCGTVAAQPCYAIAAEWASARGLERDGCRVSVGYECHPDVPLLRRCCGVRAIPTHCPSACCMVGSRRPSCAHAVRPFVRYALSDSLYSPVMSTCTRRIRGSLPALTWTEGRPTG